MTFLENLQKKLYKRKEVAFPERPQAPEELQPETARIEEIQAPRQWKKSFWARFSPFQKKAVLWGGLIFIILAVGITIFALVWGWRSFSEQQLLMKLSGTTQITSGDQVTWSLEIENKNRVTLKEAELTFYYPEGSYDFIGKLPTQKGPNSARLFIGEVKPGQVIRQEFKARILGAKGAEKVAKALLTFRPANSQIFLTKETVFRTTIEDFPVVLTLNVPPESFAGKEIFYKISYLNTASTPFHNLRLRLQYPEEFEFLESRPSPDKKNNIWELRSLAPNQSGDIQIQGIISGKAGQRPVIEASLETTQNGKNIVLTQEVAPTEIVSSPLELWLTVNDLKDYRANLGDWLKYQIRFKNDFEVPLEDVFLKAKLFGDMFDLSTLQTNGAFDITQNTITWTAHEIPSLKSLAPQKQDEISFQVKLKENFPTFSHQDKNFSVKVSAEMRTEKVPLFLGLNEIVQSRDLITKINSKLILKVQGFYNETRSSIVNFGPIPPRVGQTTTYTLHWQLLNLANDVSNTEVSAFLPAGVTWTGKTSNNFTGSTLKYDATFRKVTWHLGDVPANTGFVSPVPEAVFQVSITPAPAQVGYPVDLISEIQAKGQDQWTDVELSAYHPVINTTLPDDLTVSPEQGKVKP